MGRFCREPWGLPGRPHPWPARPHGCPGLLFSSQVAKPLEEDAACQLCADGRSIPHKASLASDAAQGSVLRQRLGRLSSARCPRPVCIYLSKSLSAQRPHGALGVPPRESPGTDWSGQQVLFSSDPPAATVLAVRSGASLRVSEHLGNLGLRKFRRAPHAPGSTPISPQRSGSAAPSLRPPLASERRKNPLHSVPVPESSLGFPCVFSPFAPCRTPRPCSDPRGSGRSSRTVLSHPRGTLSWSRRHSSACRTNCLQNQTSKTHTNASFIVFPPLSLSWFPTRIRAGRRVARSRLQAPPVAQGQHWTAYSASRLDVPQPVPAGHVPISGMRRLRLMLLQAPALRRGLDSSQASEGRGAVPLTTFPCCGVWAPRSHSSGVGGRDGTCPA